MISETTTVSFWKSSAYVPFISSAMFICEQLYLNCSLLTILVFLMFFDFVTGWYKSYRLNIAITYKRLVAGFYAKMIVFIFLIVLGLLINALVITSPKIAEYFNITSYLTGVILLLIFNEAYSIFGNIIAGKEQKEINEIDFVTLIIRKLRNKLEANIE